MRRPASGLSQQAAAMPLGRMAGRFPAGSGPGKGAQTARRFLTFRALGNSTLAAAWLQRGNLTNARKRSFHSRERLRNDEVCLYRGRVSRSQIARRGIWSTAVRRWRAIDYRRMHRPTIPVAPLQLTFPFNKTGGVISPLQIAETGISSSRQLVRSSSTSKALRFELPAVPCGPDGPASPRSPLGPGSPRSPLEPGGPGNPCGPSSPAAPRGPAGPGVRSQPNKSSDAATATAMPPTQFR
jgi:hypothetical protein